MKKMIKESTTQNESIVLERRADRELKRKGNLEEVKKAGAMRAHHASVRGPRRNNGMKTEQMKIQYK